MGDIVKFPTGTRLTQRIDDLLLSSEVLLAQAVERVWDADEETRVDFVERLMGVLAPVLAAPKQE